MNQLAKALLEAQSWCDHNGDHNTGMVSLSVDTLQHWQRMATVTVLDLLEIADTLKFKIINIATGETITLSRILLDTTFTIEELQNALNAPVHKFGYAVVNNITVLEVYI